MMMRLNADLSLSTFNFDGRWRYLDHQRIKRLDPSFRINAGIKSTGQTNAFISPVPLS